LQNWPETSSAPTRETTMTLLPDLKSLQLFVAVADCGSISEAARRTHLALAAASKRISTLESRAKNPLLERHARGTHLTPAGESMLVHARATLASLARLQSELDDFQAGVRGVIRIAANASAMSQKLPIQVGKFLTTHPAVQIQLTELGSSDTVRALRTGLADIGIFESAVVHTGIETRHYRQDKLAAVVPIGHALTRKKRITETDIFSHPLVGLHEATALNQLLARIAAQHNKVPNVRVRAGSFDAMCRLIEQGMGIGILPEESIEPQRKVLKLRCLAIEAKWAHRSHLLGFMHEPHLTAAARALLHSLAPK
jgi:DNA-binding transcriptional LysR family regulator